MAAPRLHDEVLAAGLAQGYDWFWLHLSLADHRARRFLESFDEMVPDARELLLGTEDRIQIHLTPGGGWGILPDLERDFDDEAVGVRPPGLLAGRQSADHGEAASLARQQHAARRGGDGAVAAGVRRRRWPSTRKSSLAFGKAAGPSVARTGPHRGCGAGRPRRWRGAGPLRRELSRYGREFSSLRSAIHRATGARNVVAASPLLEHLPLLQQESEDFERDAGALSDRARLLYEEIETRIASTTNRSLSALTVISTLLLPPTFLVGAFGMNLEGIPWAQTPFRLRHCVQPVPALDRGRLCRAAALPDPALIIPVCSGSAVPASSSATVIFVL